MAWEFKRSNLGGRGPDPARCKAGIYHGFYQRQCQNKPKKDGWCGIHHPDAAKARAERHRKKYEERLEARRKKRQAPIDRACEAGRRAGLEEAAKMMDAADPRPAPSPLAALIRERIGQGENDG